MNQSKTIYCTPESRLRQVRLERIILGGSEDRDMNPFSGDNDTAGDREGGIGGNDYDL